VLPGLPSGAQFWQKGGFLQTLENIVPVGFHNRNYFIVADIVFTNNGVWGFNPRYHSQFTPAGIPLEEWLFFVIIPYASIFTHYVIIKYFPNACLSDKTTRVITWILLALLSSLVLIFHSRTYTAFYSAFMAVLLTVSLFRKSRLLNRFYITYLVIMLPFFLVNGILTGSFIPGEVVWYSESGITGFRIFTVPFEDIMYGFSLIFLNLILMEKLRMLSGKKNLIQNDKN